MSLQPAGLSSSPCSMLLKLLELAHRSPKTLLTRLQREHLSKGFLYHHNHPRSLSHNLKDHLANFCLLRSRLEQATPQRLPQISGSTPSGPPLLTQGMQETSSGPAQ